MASINNLQERRALHFGISAVLLWSTVAVAFKMGLQVASPLQLLFVGTGYSTLFFLLVTRTGLLKLSKKEVSLAIGLGFLSPFAYYLILFEAYDRLPAHIAQPLNFTWAITLSLLSIPLLKQKLRAIQFGGILVSYFGVVLLLTRGEFNNWHQFDLVGVSLALASTLIWASYWIVNAKITLNAKPIMALSFVVGFVLTSLLCWQTESFPVWTNKVWLYGIWVGLIEMGITYWLWQRALALTGQVARISQLIFLAPIISLGLISIFLGEDIHWTAIVALGFIVVGITATNRR